MFIDSSATANDETELRGVELLPGEKLNYVFIPKLGLTKTPPLIGQVLITTNQRVLAFCRNHGRDETFIVPVNELSGVAVKSRFRNATSILQGTLLAAGGILLYLVAGYWLTGRFDGPNVPLINVDVGPLLLLLVALVAVYLIGRHYMSKEVGVVLFKSNNWSFEFPYRGDRASLEIYQVVNSLFAARLSSDGHADLWED